MDAPAPALSPIPLDRFSVLGVGHVAPPTNNHSDQAVEKAGFHSVRSFSRANLSTNRSMFITISANVRTGKRAIT